jgi:hypothetical protein
MERPRAAALVQVRLLPYALQTGPQRPRFAYKPSSRGSDNHLPLGELFGLRNTRRNREKYMSDAGFDLDDEETGPKALRSHAKSLEKKLADQQKLLDEFVAERSKQTVSSLLTEAKVPEWARDLYSGESTKDSVDAWAAKYAEKFGIETGKQEAPPEAAAAAQVTGLLSQAPAATTRSIADQLALLENGSDADVAAAFPGFFAQH